MNYNFKKALLFLMPLLIVASIVIYLNNFFNSLGVFIFDFSLASLLLFLVFLFVKQEIFYAWLKFAIVFILMDIIIALMFPETGDGLSIVFDREQITFFSAIIFFIMSLALILSKSFRPNWKLWIVLPIAFALGVIGVLAAIIVF